MDKAFNISHNWLDAPDKDPLMQWTSASIGITVNNTNATFNVNTESLSTSERADLAFYPMALWFVRCWWRLHWETGNVWLDKKQQNPYWRMAHELTSAGYGYIWPDLTFVSDGRDMTILGRSTSYPGEASPINYLKNLKLSIPIQSFTDEIARCVHIVLDRLESSPAIGLVDTELRQHWTAVMEEQQDPVAAKYRKIEAMLGFNPDEADESLLEAFIKRADTLGTGIVEELAAIMPNPAGNILADLDAIAQNSQDLGIKGNFSIPDGISKAGILRGKLKPFEIGRQLASELRAKCGASTDKISDQVISDLMGTSVNAWASHTGTSPFTLGVINPDDDSIRIIFKSKAKRSRRFQACRLVADKLISNADNHWFPVSSAATVRQKIQRAFAGEFLCPFERLNDFLGGHYDEDSIAEAAEYFDVSEQVPITHLVNRGYMVPDALNNDQAAL
ncbi:MAG: hypothetical protein LBP55_08550 [Candidatus Adiutrix sp.]|jgi:hypothetical protein|nr:hypothetical protein [Candidatus Adiutrix sp.]